MSKYLVLFSSVLLIVLTGCANPAINTPSITDSSQFESPFIGSDTGATAAGRRTLTVYAAASLTSAFQEIGENFEAVNPGVHVRFNFAGSQILRTQIEQGAVADVFASADHKNMDLLVNDNLIVPNSYQDFATNKLIVIFPAGNPGNVQTVEDLARPNLKLVLADVSVPAGNYARQIFTKMSSDPAYSPDFSAKVLANVVSNETDVKQVVTKVELGEADAGIVYVSDKVAASDLGIVIIPDKFNVIANYPIAVLTKSPEPKLTTAFIDYVMSAPGQAVLLKWGFERVTR